MDWMIFISNMTEHIAWPATAIALGFLLKNNIGDLLPRLEKFKHKDTEIAFAKSVQSIEDKADEVVESGYKLTSDLKEEESRLLSKIDFAPHPVIYQAYSILERELLELYDQNLTQNQRVVISTREGRNVRQSLGVSQEFENNMRELRKIRNYIMNNRRFLENDISTNQIKSYIELALDSTQYIRELIANKSIKQD